ncbi:MAG TPA: 4-hydroxy-tetrahydrodipicolinate synthase [Longimicrobiales bacterium]|nr:4-hydroxy-tetrahydrodipicolinate synthase [Longimicrobiales bacterium]
MSHEARFQGVGPALVTPMTDDGEVDFDALALHVTYMLDGGVDFLVPCGTTGESATLSPAEQKAVIRCCVETADGRAPVLAGAGSNNTRVAVELARGAAEAGADGVLVVTPYYNKPGPDGLVLHYGSVAEAGLPIILYNVPGRTGANVAPEVILRIADEVPEVVGVKESSGSVDPVMTLVREAPRGFAVLCGDDHLGLAATAMGAHGLISVVANETPARMSAIIHRALAGQLEEARELHYRLLPLMRANFLESNPGPVKAAMAILGRMGDRLRPPLAPVRPGTRAALKAALAELGAINEERT